MTMFVRGFAVGAAFWFCAAPVWPDSRTRLEDPSRRPPTVAPRIAGCKQERGDQMFDPCLKLDTSQVEKMN